MAYLPSTFRSRTLVIPLFPVATSGSPVDSGSVVLPGDVTSYIIESIYANAATAAGTLATGTIDLRTAAAGAGSSVLNAATALTGLTAANLVQAITPAALGTRLTATTLYVRQTVNSLNAGTVNLYINILVLS